MAGTEGKLDILTICGSLRKGSYNRSLMRALTALAPPEMALREAPTYATIPHYNHDLQNESGFPEAVTAWSDAIRNARLLHERTTCEPEDANPCTTVYQLVEELNRHVR